MECRDLKSLLLRISLLALGGNRCASFVIRRKIRLDVGKSNLF